MGEAFEMLQSLVGDRYIRQIHRFQLRQVLDVGEPLFRELLIEAASIALRGDEGDRRRAGIGRTVESPSAARQGRPAVTALRD
jgi:hypothetical protein